MEYIITFKNTNRAIKAEHCLLSQNISVGVLPLPPQISAGCGICLRVGRKDMKAALRFLLDGSIDTAGIFYRAAQDGGYRYTKIKDEEKRDEND